MSLLNVWFSSPVSDIYLSFWCGTEWHYSEFIKTQRCSVVVTVSLMSQHRRSASQKVVRALDVNAENTFILVSLPWAGYTKNNHGTRLNVSWFSSYLCPQCCKHLNLAPSCHQRQSQRWCWELWERQGRCPYQSLSASFLSSPWKQKQTQGWLEVLLRPTYCTRHTL